MSRCGAGFSGRSHFDTGSLAQSVGKEVQLHFKDEDDHKDIQEAMLDVAPRWTHIGGSFRIKRSAIKGINSRDCQESLAEVVSMWLNQDYNVERFGPPTWRWLVKAVAEEAGGSNPALAERIAIQHPLPSEVARDGQSHFPSVSHVRPPLSRHMASSSYRQPQRLPTTSGATGMLASWNPHATSSTYMDQSYVGPYTAGYDTLQSHGFPSPSGSTYGPRSPIAQATSSTYVDRSWSDPYTASYTSHGSRSPIAQATSSTYRDRSPSGSCTTRCTPYSPRTPTTQETTRTVVAREVSPTGFSSLAKLGSKGSGREPRCGWFPSGDGKIERVRIATDGSNMVFTGYEPYFHTNHWPSVSLSCGDILIERQRGKRVSPYPMSPPHVSHGIAVIINNETFDSQPSREGSRIDECNLIQVFRYLRYKVEVYRDCTSDDMFRIFEGIKLRDHWNSDSFVCCILSHGSQGTVYGSDSKKVVLDHLTKKLNAKSCKSLAGKPKLFFVQACRGSLRETAVRIACDGGMIELPNEADFLFSYATPSGQACYRDLDHGSWYISELCQVLCQSATYLHLNDMLTEVHGRVSKYKVNENCQVPEITQRLQKNVYFL